MLKTGLTSMKVICQHARECRAKTTEYARRSRTVYLITNVTAQPNMRGETVKCTKLVNQRTAMQGNVYQKNPTLKISFAFVLWVEWVCSAKQVREHGTFVGGGGGVGVEHVQLAIS